MPGNVNSQARVDEVPIGPLFREPHVVVQASLYAGLAQAGFPEIRPAHGCVFGHLRPEGSTITEIAHFAQLTKATVVAAVDDLETLGYVERLPDPRDRRAKIIRLTAKGQQAVAAADEIFAEIERDWAKRLGARKMRELRTLLDQLHGLLLDDLAEGFAARGSRRDRPAP